MISVALAGKSLHITASPRETNRLKEIPGTRYLRKKNVWTLPLGLTALAFLTKYNGEVTYDEAADQALNRLREMSTKAVASQNLATPVPIWYNGPHAKTQTIPYPHVRVLRDGVPTVEPATDQVLSKLLAEGAQHAGPKHKSSPSIKAEAERKGKAASEWLPEAIREARASQGGRAGHGTAVVFNGDSTPRGRGQAEQLSDQPPSDDEGGAHSPSLSLYPFQQTDVGFIIRAGRSLVANEMGTGKGPTSAVAIWLRGVTKLLVVCPNSLKGVWESELTRWTTFTPFVVDGSAKKRRETIAKAAAFDGDMAVIINYESLVKHTEEAPFGNTVLSDKDKEPGELNEIDWGAVVVDEAHRIKSPKAHSTRAVWGVSRKARVRIALTGTPVVNNPDDLWSIMHFLDPEGWPSRNRFRDAFCHMRVGFHGGYENLGIREDSRAKLDVMVKPSMIRRTKTEVLPQLPEKILTERFLPMGPKQKKAYNQMVDYMMAEVEQGVLNATDPLTLVGRLRYCASAFPVVNDEGQVVALSTPSNKLDEVKAILTETTGPLVVYGESRKLMEMMQQELQANYRIGMITGAIPVQARQGFVEQFQNGELDVILATTGAGAEGITLTASSTLVMAQESWSNVANKQAHDRIHRIGQDRGTTIITLISENSIDVAVHYATMEKEGQLQSLVQDPEWLAAAARGKQ